MVGGQKASELNAQLRERISKLQAYFKCDVLVKWECSFDEEMRTNLKMQKFVEKLDLLDPLHPRRDALRGGRVEPFKLLHECGPDEELLYFDIVSFKKLV